MIEALAKGWTLHVRSEADETVALDLRFSLAGSRRAIERACARP